MIDRLAAEGSLEADAIAFAKHIVESGVEVVRVRDRDEKLAPHRGETKIYDDFRAKNARKFRGFPAPENIIKAIQAAVELPYAEGKKRERELFTELASSVKAKAQQYTFFAERAAKKICLLYTSPSPRDQRGSRMPSSA